jgi:di/tricarboxylate transporter
MIYFCSSEILPMTFPIALVLGLLVVAIILFASEKFSIDVVTIGLLLVLIFAGILSPKDAFNNFSSDFMVLLASIFVITGAMSETGMLDAIGERLVRISSKNQTLLVLNVMIVTSVISTFMNNTTTAALMVGPVIGMCRKMNMSPSRVLMPMAFSSMIGGNCTIISTSTNVAVSGYIANAGMQPLGFWEIFSLGAIITGVGITYMMLTWKWIFPDRKHESFIEEYKIREYFSEIFITHKSKLVGQNVFVSDLSKQEIRIVKILRLDGTEVIPDADSVFWPEDIVLVECKLDNLIGIKEASGIELRGDLITDTKLAGNKMKLAEALVTPSSNFVGRTLKDTGFRQRYNVVVLAIHRFNENIAAKIGNTVLETGDLLLIQGTEQSINSLRQAGVLKVLDDIKVTMFRRRKGILTACIFIAAVISGSLEWVPLSVAFLSAALLTVIIGAIRPERVYRLIDWRLMILIGGMSAFGVAMDKSGTAQFLADKITNAFGSMGAMPVMAAFCVLVIFLTQPMSNAAAALVVLPVAIHAAQMMGVNPRTFAIAIMMTASISLATPFEPASVLVYGAGKYKFMDFIKAGLPLTIILVIITILLVPVFWPLK